MLSRWLRDARLVLENPTVIVHILTAALWMIAIEPNYKFHIFAIKSFITFHRNRAAGMYTLLNMADKLL